MSENPQTAIDDRVYEALRSEVGRLLEPESQSAEHERARRYWEVGRRIQQALAPHGRRAQYGDSVVRRLAQDVEVRHRLLYDMLRLYRGYPRGPARRGMGWTHYRLLLRVEGRRARAFYGREAEAHGWSSRQLEMHIEEGLYERVHGEGGGEWEDLPRGRPYTYLVSDAGAGSRLELGFGVRTGDAVVELAGLEAGQVVESVRQRKGIVPFRARAVDADAGSLFTYGARVERVVDGDTLAVTVDLGFGVEVEERVRLRGIDAPEMSAAAGERARVFVVEALAATRRVVLATRRRDKYGRWLADVYYEPGLRSLRRTAREGRLLNRELVAAGLAARYG